MKIPTFFIVGAPKCGTTALSTYLGENPSVFIPSPKELNFFCQDLIFKDPITAESDYLAIFEKSKGASAVGDASPLYFISEVAAAQIYQFNPDAKIIIMLRPHPDFLYSFHSHLVYLGEENVSNFEDAWSIHFDRLNGIKKYPSTCREPKRLNYSKVGQLGRQVERFLLHFPRESIKFILLEDLVRSPRRVYEETLEFIGSVDDGRMLFQVVNARKRHKFNFIARAFHHLPDYYVKFSEKIKKKLGISKYSITKIVFNAIRDDRMDLGLSIEMKNILIDEFKNDTLLLSSLIERDLNHWLIK